MFHVVIRARQNHGRMKKELCLGVYETIEEALKVSSENMFSYVTISCPHCKEKESNQ